MMLENFLLSLLFCLGLNLLFFLFAFLFKTDKLTDFTYGLTFILLSFFMLLKNGTFFGYQVFLTFLIFLWGIRLITYLLVRILKIKKDKRFDGMRESFLKFLRFWVFQGLTAWVIMAPSVYLLSLKEDRPFGLLMVLGALVWALGLGTETVADWQKFTFKNKKENKGKWTSSGLWAYSRHPNYFGEMVCWWGLFIFALPFLEGLAWLTIVGPFFITFILLFVSGIPFLEKRYEKKYAGNKAYQAYREKTSLLVLWPPKK